MYLRIDSVTVDSDEGRCTLEVMTVEGDRLTLDIHDIDLSAFYDQVKARLGPYIHEMDAAREAVARGVSLEAFVCAPADVDESGGYDTSDPKHPRYHSTHVDLWDAREGK